MPYLRSALLACKLLLLPVLLVSNLHALPRVSGVVSGNGHNIPAAMQLTGGASTTCSPDGTYELVRLDTTAVWIHARHFGFAADSLLLPSGPADLSVDFDLDAVDAALLQGQVLDAQSEPVAHARVDLVPTPLQPVFTDSAGLFFVTLPLGGTYTVQASHLELGLASADVLLNGPQSLVLDLDPLAVGMPSPPDAYGYRIADSQDPLYGPEHVWQSIAAPENLMTAGIGVSIPFDFGYYGGTYDAVGLSIYGYIVIHSSSGLGYAANTHLPSTSGANLAVYPYWDRLNPAGGGAVYRLYRPETGEFVIEYNQVPVVGSPIPATFQVVLQDPAVWPTLTGDSRWLIHYPVPVGTGCSIGLENASGTAGLEYLYNGVYAPTSRPLAGSVSLAIEVYPLAGSLSGVVYDDAGNPFAGANITAGDLSSVTGPDGTFGFTLPSGPVELMIEHYEHLPWTRMCEIRHDSPLQLPVYLTPLPRAVFAGVVLDENNQPIEGVEILFPGSDNPPLYTDASGQFSRPLVDGLEYELRLRKAGVGSLLATVSMNGDSFHEFTLAQDPTYLTSPPDADGYRAFDYNDAGGMVVDFHDSSVSPVQLSLNSNGWTFFVMPFNFLYRGEIMSRVAVARDGYIVPWIEGESWPTALRRSYCSDRSVPSDTLPNGAIFGLWDCLEERPGSGIYTRHLADQHAFEVSWEGFSVVGENDPINFRITILDPVHWPSPDGEATFVVSYDCLPGPGSVAGLENLAGTTGLAYLQHGVYGGDWASPIAPGTSVVYSTRPTGLLTCSDNSPPEIMLHQAADTPLYLGPFPITAEILHPCGLQSVELMYRLDGQSWITMPMVRNVHEYTASIPGPLPAGTLVEYKVSATAASDAPAPVESMIQGFLVEELEVLQRFDFETGDWQGFTQDGSCSGDDGWTLEPYGEQGWVAESPRLGNCVLATPVLDLGNCRSVFLRLWHKAVLDSGGEDEWYYPVDIMIRVDNGVTNEWLYSLSGSHTGQVVVDEGTLMFDISHLVGMADSTRFRFTIWFLNHSTWRIDDVCLLTYPDVVPELDIARVPEGDAVRLEWSPARDITLYDVYTSATPGGPWTLLAQVEGLELVVPVQAGNHFFQVKGVCDTEARITAH